MKRASLLRDIIGTATIFFVLVVFTFIIMLGEHFLDNFKAH